MRKLRNMEKRKEEKKVREKNKGGYEGEGRKEVDEGKE